MADTRRGGMNDQGAQGADRRDQDDLRASNGEVVRRVDLERAVRDWRVAGHEGQDLARRSLAGDAQAIDRVHDAIGLALPGVTEYSEGDVIRLAALDATSEGRSPHQRCAVFLARSECGNNTCVDAAEFVGWILSSDGRAALARRGVPVAQRDPLSDEQWRVLYQMVVARYHYEAREQRDYQRRRADAVFTGATPVPPAHDGGASMEGIMLAIARRLDLLPR